MADGIPRQIGRYKILGEIGRGGFGRVYRALDPTVGRPVAIKILTEATEDVVNRFHHEAMVAGNLRHKNIVIVYDYGDHDGKPFLSMEYLEGDTIQQLVVSRKPLTILDKCNIMAQVAEGLHHAHRSGVIHRDVKPGNVMVLPDATVKIMDFGIARVISDQEATRLTQEGSVIGTISYMSPEQFGGIAQVDALCDIFAFGVSWYEFLTGHHPFEASDARAMMYKITFEEPLPISKFIEDFPDSLQRVISRTLSKDRDLRYPSLKEVQFDLEPIRIELQQQRAASLLVQAQDLFDKGQLDPAQNVVLEVLTLDPSNSVARSLYETVQKQIRQRTLQPRIEATLKSGEEQLTQRRFSDAVKSFEAALRLDADNLYIQNRLNHARGLLEHSKEAASLLTEARRQLANQNLTSAYRCITEALRHDPEYKEAAELLETVQAVMAERQREQRIADALQKAESLKVLYSYNEAIGILTALGREADDQRVRILLDQIQKEQAEQERRTKLRNQLTTGTDLLRERKLTEAVQFLSGVKEEFPESAEVASLLSYTQKELEAETRAKVVEKASTEAESLIAEHRYDAALGLLDETLQQYPGEGTLIRRLGATIAAKGQWDLEQTVHRVSAESEALRAQLRFPDAIEVVEAGLREYPSEPRLIALLDGIEKAWAQDRRAQAVKKATEQAQEFLTAKQPTRAVQVLQPVLAQYPDEPALTELLTRANEEIRAQEKARAVQAIQQQARQFAKANKFDQASDALEKGLAAFPEEPVLLRHRGEILEQQKAWERQQSTQAAIAKATALQSSRRFDEAAQIIGEARRQYPDETPLAQFDEQLKRAWDQHKRSEAIREISREARKRLSEQKAAEAIELLDAGLRKYPAERELEQLAAEAKRAAELQKRVLAIQLATRLAKELVSAQDFEAARRVVEDHLKQYPGDADLMRQKEEVAAARRAWERVLEVQGTVEKANQLAAAEQFQAALATLASVLRKPPYEPELTEAKRRIEAGFEAHNRKLAMAQTSLDATALLDKGQLDEAMQALRAAAERYPEGDWKSLIDRARREIEARSQAAEKARAVAAIERDATSLATRRQFEAALKLVAQGLNQYPGDPTLTECQKGLHFARQQQERAAAIDAAAQKIAQSIEQERFDDALQVLESSNRDFAGEVIFNTLRARCDEAMEARRRRDQAVHEAESLIEERHFADAVAVLERALAAASPRDPRLTAIRDRARQLEKEAQDREEGIRRFVTDIQKLAQQGQFPEALSKATQGLKAYGDEPRIAKLRDEMRMRKGLADARVLLDQTRPDDALRVIEETSTGFVSLQEVKALTKRAREQQQVMARAAAITAEAKNIRDIFNSGDLENALAMAGDALRQWPDAPQLMEVRELILAAKAARERQLAVEEAVRHCESLRKENRPDTALVLVQRLLTQFDNEPALLKLKQSIESELRERDQRERRKRALQEVRNIAEESKEVSSPSDITELLASLDHLVKENAGDKEICDGAGEVIRYLRSIEDARRKLAEGDFSGVVEAAEQHLSRAADHVIFSGLKKEAESRLRLSYLQDVQNRSEAEPDLGKRIVLFEEALARFPDEARIADELQLTRNKLSLVNGALERARDAENRGDWDAAWKHWNSLTKIHEQQPNLKAEIERVQRMREQVRRQAIQDCVHSIEESLAAGDLTKAEETLRQAERQYSGVSRFAELGKELESRRKKVARVRELYSQAEKAVRSDWQKAEALLTEAAALGSGLSPPEELVRSLGQRKREADIASLLKTANQSRIAGNLAAALTALEEGLRKYPGEPNLTTLAGSLRDELRNRHDALVSELLQIRKTADTADSLAVLEERLNRVTAIGSENQQDSEISALAAQIITAIKTRMRGLKRAELLGGLMAHRKSVAATAVALLVVTAGWFGAKGILNANREIPVTITGNVQGMNVAGGGKHCITPDCTLSLKPGDYRLTATKPGYQMIQVPLKVTADQHGVAVPLSLEPLPNLLQINTNFASGSVSVDRGPLRPLVNGAFSAAGLPPGSHTVRVTDGNAEFQARWRTAVGEKPQLTGKMNAKDVDAAVLENVGSDGAIACNCGGLQVTVDGNQAGLASEKPSEVARLTEGVRQIGIGSRSVVLDVKPNPTLSIILTLDRNVGTLVIEAGIPNAKVFLNNQVRGETTGRDVLRIPVAVGQYAIRLEKGGLQAPEQTVDVSKGEEKRVTFSMAPVQASLEISAAMPGAQVMLDGRAAGQTDASGVFRAQGLTAAKHSIELLKEGYTPAHLETQLAAGTTTRIAGSQLAMAKIAAPPPRIDPAEVEAQDWSRVRNSTTADDLDAFARSHPGGAHVEEAKSRAGRLRQEAAQAGAAREAAAQAEAAWTNLDKTKKASIQDFLSRFAGSGHAGEARTLLARIEKQEEDARIERARLQAEQEHAQNASNQLALQQQQITRTLTNYEAAYNRLSLPDLRGIWTDMPEETAQTIGRQFQISKAVVLQLSPAGPATIDGNSAAVNCSRTLTFTPKDSRKPISATDRVRVTLARSSGGWVIRGITHY